MLNIKEIAPKLTQKLSIAINDDEAAEFAEALIAELAKQNEPVALIDGNDEAVYFRSDVMYHYWIGRNCTPLFTFPPDKAQIEQETAEAIARMLENGSFLTPESRVALAANGAAKAIRNGAWKEFKK